VGPLRDGMNLVARSMLPAMATAKECFVLSEFAGAAAEMGEALMINPFDEERTEATVETCLALDPRERRLPHAGSP